MTIQLRDYQQELVDSVRAALRRSRRVLAQLPTGGGKTACAAFMTNTPAITWFICHRQELITQAHLTFRKYGIDHSIVGAGYPLNPAARVQICSIDTLKNRLHLLPPPKVRLWDECHHMAAAGWLKVLQAHDCFDVGFSATPSRLDGTGLDVGFQEMVEGPQSSWLIGGGYLSDYRLFAPPPPVDLKARGKNDGVDGQAKVLNQPKLTGDVVATWLRRARGMRTVGFACNVQHSMAMVAAFNAAGIPAAHIDGTMKDDERRRVIRDFATGRILVLWNVALIGEGFDLAAIAQMDVSIDCVILNRQTKSLSLYLQWVGRALRPMYAPGFDLGTAEGRLAAMAAGPKPYAVILDHGGNAAIHGMPCDEREWSLEGEVKRGKKGDNDNGPPPPVNCPGCYNQVRRPLPECCPECGTPIIPPAKEIKVADGELVEVTPDERRRIRAQQLREQEACKTLGELVALGQRRGYKTPQQWAFKVWSARMRKRPAVA